MGLLGKATILGNTHLRNDRNLVGDEQFFPCLLTCFCMRYLYDRFERFYQIEKLFFGNEMRYGAFSDHHIEKSIGIIGFIIIGHVLHQNLGSFVCFRFVFSKAYRSHNIYMSPEKGTISKANMSLPAL